MISFIQCIISIYRYIISLRSRTVSINQYTTGFDPYMISIDWYMTGFNWWMTSFNPYTVSIGSPTIIKFGLLSFPIAMHKFNGAILLKISLTLSHKSLHFNINNYNQILILEINAALNYDFTHRKWI